MRVSQHIYIVSMRVHIILSGKSVGFRSETSCVVLNQVVKPRQIFGPSNMLASELFHGCEVLEVFVIQEYQYSMG